LSLNKLFDIQHYFKKYAKEGLIVILTNIVQFFEKLLIVIILARFLEINVFGIYGLALTINGLFSQLLFGPFLSGFSRFNPISHKSKEEKFFLSSSSILWVKFLLFVILISILSLPIFYLFNKSDFLQLFFLVILYTLISNLCELIVSYYQSLRKRIQVFSIRLIELIGKVSLLVFVGFSSLETVFIYFILIHILIVVINIDFIKHLVFIKNNEKVNYWREKIIIYIKPFLYWGIFLWIYLNSGKWLLEIIDTTDNVGLYNGIYQIGYTSILLIGSTINAFLLPILFQKTDISGSAEIDIKFWYRRIIFFGILTTIFITFICTIISKPLVQLILGEKFTGVHYLFPYMILAGALYTMSNVIAGFSYAKNKPQILLHLNIITSIVSFFVTSILIYYFSLYGAVIALLISSLFYFIVIHFKVKQIL
jgi:O-antigen/teichoic acid export membrane protein